jgi:hypothetical protein
VDSQHPVPIDAAAQCIAGRYVVQGELGRGGMAVVYRVSDLTSGRELALKQLVPLRSASFAREATLLFEREFHTLTQLSHPRVIEVYDYGLAAGSAYYTMELLDGRDLRELSPLAWREACALLYDVCSSLALLHSRRLVHRDVSPRNIRCTRDGLAKLIDFGALVPMGAGGRVVGTPSFVAPEVVHRLATDARTDLFSLGATLYYAVTGRTAYPARDFADLATAWSLKPLPPSSMCEDVPPALDALTMSLLSLEPALRPRTAFEVMQRLAALAGLTSDEPASVSRAYLSTPVMFGRDAALLAVRQRLATALAGRGGGGVLIGGSAGVGRSRMLDACVLEAKTHGATVLRASAGASRGDGVTVAHALAEQLLEALPAEAAASAQANESVLSALLEPASPDADDGGARREGAACWQLKDALRATDLPAAARAALSSWIAGIARRRPIAIAVDDVHKIDEPSAALLVALTAEAAHQRAFLMLTAESGARGNAQALAVLAEHCTAVTLTPLSEAQSHELLKSVFGDVANIGLVAARIHGVSAGNPRECMDLAQHLIDKGLVQYDGGSWALPSRLDAGELPSSGEQAFCERVAALSPLARWIAETHALAAHDAFSRPEYALMCAGRDAQQLDQALGELLAQQVVWSDGLVYALSHGNCAPALTARLDPADRRERHRALAEVYESAGADEALSVGYHLFGAGLLERGVDRLMAYVRHVEAESSAFPRLPAVDAAWVASIYERALTAAQQLGRPARDLHDLRRALIHISIIADDAVYGRAAPELREQLERDSGLSDYRELAHVEDRAERLKLALTRAFERYARTPEAERVCPPDEAIKQLVQFVVVSIPLGARTLDARLLASLPGLIEPFIALSPLIEAMWENAVTTYEVNCAARQNQARLRVAAIYRRLEPIEESELRFVNAIRHALAYCVGAVEAGLGLMSAMSWAELLDRDPLQKVNAMYIRRVVRLQQGDAEGAEHYRKQAELLAAQASSRQMFNNSLAVQLGAYAMAHDLTGVKEIVDATAPLAERCPGWRPVHALAQGHFERLRGNLPAALAIYERCLAYSEDDPSEPWRSIATWPRAVASTIETLVALGRCEEARRLGERALVRCGERGLDTPVHEIARTLALAEARLGDYARATERLSRVIAEQRELGVSGLLLGAVYEARARIAIWAGDSAAVEEYAKLTAQEYSHGRGSPLGALYERLMDEARRAGVQVLPQLSEFESTMMSATRMGQPGTPKSGSLQALRHARTSAERAALAIKAICEARGARAGHLYLASESGLTLAASHASAPPDARLLELVTFAGQESRTEMATAPLTDPPPPSASTPGFFTDAPGAVHRPLLLTCSDGGRELCAGVAVVVLDGAQSVAAGAAAIVAGVAARLIEAGDAQAAPVEDVLRGALAGRGATARVP